VFIEAGAESVNEGDGTDVQACLVHMGRTGAVGLQSLCDHPQKDAQHHAQHRSVALHEVPQPLGHGEHPLAHRQAGEYVIVQVRCCLHHAPGGARGADSPAFAGEGYKVVVPTVAAASAGKAMGKERKYSEEVLLSKGPATTEGAAVAELLVTPTREDRIARLAELTKGPIAVEIQDLTKSYGDRQIFGDLDLQVRAGEIVALLGPSGSGKSTLLRCINRLETWNSGDVFIGGHRIGYSSGGLVLSPSEVARQRVEVGVGMLFQHFNLFAHLTAEENIAGPLRWVHGWSQEAAAQRAQELLDRVGLGDRGDTLPRHLSGGQQQRVAIARAIAPGAKVLLLDEPTSALDPEMVGEVLDVIRRLAFEEKLTMIISTHQLRFAEEVADRVIFLTDGNIVEDGPAYEVLSQPRNPLTARFIRVMSSGQTSALAL